MTVCSSRPRRLKVSNGTGGRLRSVRFWPSKVAPLATTLGRSMASSLFPFELLNETLEVSVRQQSLVSDLERSLSTFAVSRAKPTGRWWMMVW